MQYSFLLPSGLLRHPPLLQYIAFRSLHKWWGCKAACRQSLKWWHSASPVFIIAWISAAVRFLLISIKLGKSVPAPFLYWPGRRHNSLSKEYCLWKEKRFFISCCGICHLCYPRIISWILIKHTIRAYSITTPFGAPTVPEKNYACSVWRREY